MFIYVLFAWKYVYRCPFQYCFPETRCTEGVILVLVPRNVYVRVRSYFRSLRKVPFHIVALCIWVLQKRVMVMNVEEYRTRENGFYNGCLCAIYSLFS